MLIHGDCIDVMAGMDPESVDAIVTDPPYNIGFMGKEWDGDGIAFKRETWEAAYRVAKPSAYLLAFGGTRTVHRMTVALEDAGWIIRDMLVWGYASGFPKSKASLKPAWEPIVMARKPGPLRMLAIDECRIGTDVTTTIRSGGSGAQGIYGVDDREFERENPAGRWPANIVLTDPIFDGGIEGVVGGGETQQAWGKTSRGGNAVAVGDVADQTVGRYGMRQTGEETDFYKDTGTYSRFFLIPKAARSDREPVLGGQTERTNIAFGNGTCLHCGHARFDGRRAGPCCEEPNYEPRQVRARENVHPTVKPVDLMRHLVRLVTPTGGTVLDPFLGSGTTALAAEMEGFPWIGIEREAEYVAIAEARLNGTQRGLGIA
jgi:site-specific DNA-methyltransferase (adenine-specific)